MLARKNWIMRIVVAAPIFVFERRLEERFARV
jgi:hypothetical protein